MIRPPGWGGVVFSEGSEGDMRNDTAARRALAGRLGIDAQWATIRQVHGNSVLRVDTPGEAGEADAMWTTEPGLALAVFTADCFGVVLAAEMAVGVAHAGWRGARSGVVDRLRREMTREGHPPARAAVGPGIGPCCYEVGPEVSGGFDGFTAETTWGTPSVDLGAAVSAQVRGLDTWSAGACTQHDERWHSHRRDQTRERLVSIGWL